MKQFFLYVLLWLFWGGIGSSLCAENRVKVACVGNSVTFGYGLRNPAVESYPAQLQRLLGPGYEVRNFGKSGATLLRHGHRPYMLQEEYRQAVDFAGDIVVIHLGLNDTDPRNWPDYRDEFVKDYLALIAGFREANPRCRIIVCRMTPVSHRHLRFESGTRDWHTDIQQAIETVACVAGVQLTDFHQVLYPYHHLLPDALHPTAEGAGLLAGHVRSVITGDFGGLQLSPLYSDYMILQRNQPLVLQGKADAGSEVTVCIGGQKRRATANGDGMENIKSLDPLLYSQLTHQKYIRTK